VTKRIIVPDKHPISEVIGACTVNGIKYELKRGLLATLDAARRTGAGLPILAEIQVTWYEETQGKVPASCLKTLALARAAA
jgi:hypothetical protein